jgi:hypothetical protein
MPVLDRKGYGRRKPNEKSTVNTRNTEVSSTMWEIMMYVPNAQRLHQINQFLLANRQWAFVWSHRHSTSNHFYLSGSIVFQTPHTANWLHANLGNGDYELPNEDPNTYRHNQIDLAEEYQEGGNIVIILIDDGHF